MESREDYYGLLGVSCTESLEGIHKAYRRLAKEYHPDHAGGQSAERFHAIHEAYEILSDVDRRRDYDRRLRQKPIPSHTAEPLLRPTRPFVNAEPFRPPPFGADLRPDIFDQLVRRELWEFARVAEMLLSPIRLSPRLTLDEEAFIRLYLEELIERYRL
jgi:curved DNA-binding protein CbpA